MDHLGVIRADIEPRATEHIQEMLNLTERLIADGKAYATPSGDVYFRVRSAPATAKLSGRTPDDLRSGARVVPGDGRPAGLRPLESAARRTLLEARGSGTPPAGTSSARP